MRSRLPALPHPFGRFGFSLVENSWPTACFFCSSMSDAREQFCSISIKRFPPLGRRTPAPVRPPLPRRADCVCQLQYLRRKRKTQQPLSRRINGRFRGAKQHSPQEPQREEAGNLLEFCQKSKGNPRNSLNARSALKTAIASTT